MSLKGMNWEPTDQREGDPAEYAKAMAEFRFEDETRRRAKCRREAIQALGSLLPDVEVPGYTYPHGTFERFEQGCCCVSCVKAKAQTVGVVIRSNPPVTHMGLEDEITALRNIANLPPAFEKIRRRELRIRESRLRPVVQEKTNKEKAKREKDRAERIAANIKPDVVMEGRRCVVCKKKPARIDDYCKKCARAAGIVVHGKI